MEEKKEARQEVTPEESSGVQLETEEKSPEQDSLAKEQKKKKILRILAIAALSLALLFFVLFGAYHAILDYYLGKINFVTKEEETVFETQRLEEEIYTRETEEVKTGSEEEEEEEPLENVDSLYSNATLPPICDTKDVTNILLLATDIEGNQASRSDTMILLSVNSKTKKIVLCSFLRDIWAKYPQNPPSPVAGSYDKLNHACAYGGPTLTMAVLKETFNIDVKHYMKVDFGAFIQVVDIMGGVEMELSAEEAKYINEMARHVYPGQLSPLPEQAGKHLLNGKHALCHARNRTIGADWARTQRQRNIISQLFSQAKSLSLGQLDALLETVFPLITTNMPKSMLKDFVSGAFSYLSYDLVSTRIPLNGSYSSLNYNLVPDLEINCKDLYEKIYGQKEN